MIKFERNLLGKDEIRSITKLRVTISFDKFAFTRNWPNDV